MASDVEIDTLLALHSLSRKPTVLYVGASPIMYDVRRISDGKIVAMLNFTARIEDYARDFASGMYDIS